MVQTYRRIVKKLDSGGKVQGYTHVLYCFGQKKVPLAWVQVSLAPLFPRRRMLMNPNLDVAASSQRVGASKGFATPEYLIENFHPELLPVDDARTENNPSYGMLLCLYEITESTCITRWRQTWGDVFPVHSFGVYIVLCKYLGTLGTCLPLASASTCIL